MIQWLDKKGRTLFVSKGIGEDTYATFYRKNTQGCHRIKSPDLPVRGTIEEAEADLAAYVEKHGLVPVTVSHEEE